MEIVDYVPTKFDTSKFVNYLSEELTTPTEKELNEELPEWKHREAFQQKIEEKASKPRRGVGFLRAEDNSNYDDQPADSETQIEDSFGKGIDDSEIPLPVAKPRVERPSRPNSKPKPATKRTESPTTASEQLKTDSEDGQESRGRGRKRRRRRGRRSDGSPGGSDGNSSQPTGQSTPEVSAARQPESRDSAPISERKTGDRKPRSRRRKRGPKPPGSDASPKPSSD